MVKKIFRNSNFSDFLGIKSEIHQFPKTTKNTKTRFFDYKLRYYYVIWLFYVKTDIHWIPNDRLWFISVYNARFADALVKHPRRWASPTHYRKFVKNRVQGKRDQTFYILRIGMIHSIRSSFSKSVNHKKMMSIPYLGIQPINNMLALQSPSLDIQPHKSIFNLCHFSFVQLIYRALKEFHF